jgi:hypothetical protein
MAEERESPGPDQPKTGVLFAESSTPEHQWLPPNDRPPSRRGRWVLGCVIAGALVFLIGPLVALGILSVTGLGTAAEYAIYVGTGGIDCDLTDTGDTFPVGTEVRVIANFSPSLPAGSTVSINVERDGTDLPDEHIVLDVDTEANCIHGTFPFLEPGHHVVRYESDALAGPGISAEFDITAE